MYVKNQFPLKDMGEHDGNQLDMDYWCGDGNQRTNVTFGCGGNYQRELRSLNKVG